MIHLKRFGVGLLVGLLTVAMFTVFVYLIKYYPLAFFGTVIVALLYMLGGAILGK